MDETKKTKREEWGGGAVRKKCTKFCLTLLRQSLNTKQAKKREKNDTSKQYSNQANTGEVERNQ